MPAAYKSTASVCPDCGQRQVRGVCAACSFGELLGTSLDACEPELAAADCKPSLDVEFGRYHLKDRLGSGGMGVIYAAEDATLGRSVALKVIRGVIFADTGDLSRFTIEAEAAAALDHPNIVPIYEVGVVEDQPFFTMKLIRGESLAVKLRGATTDTTDTLPPRQIAEWVGKMAQAVHHAHQRGGTSSRFEARKYSDWR